MQLRQLQPGLLQATLFALIVLVLLTPDLLILTAAVLLFAACVTLGSVFSTNPKEANFTTALLVLFTALLSGAAGGGIASLVFLWPIEGIVVSSLLAAGAGLAYAIFYWKRVMIFVPKGQTVVVRGLFGSRQIRGPTRASPPLPVLEWVTAIIPTAPLEAEQVLHEVETSRPSDRVNLTVVDTTYIAGSEPYALTRRIHQVRTNTRYQIDAQQWHLLLELPNLNQRATAIAAQLPSSPHGWRQRPEVWERVISQFIDEEQERAGRRVVHRSRLAPLEVSYQRERLECLLLEQLRTELGRYSVRISEVEIIAVDIDPVETIRLARQAELLAYGETARLSHVGATMGQMELGLANRIVRLFTEAGQTIDASDVELMLRHYLRSLNGRPSTSDQLEDFVDQFRRRNFGGPGPLNQREAA